jgi:hypothetical protein
MTNVQEHGLGKVEILWVKRGPGLSIRIQHSLEGRHGMPTIVHFVLLDPSSQPLAEGKATFLPRSNAHMGQRTMRVPIEKLQTHPVWGALMDMGQPVCLRWKVEFRDHEGHVLTCRTFEDEYDVTNET